MNNKSYKFYDIHNKVVIESNDAEFYDHIFPFELRNNGGSCSNNQSGIRINEPDQPLNSDPRRSKRIKVTRDYSLDF